MEAILEQQRQLASQHLQVEAAAAEVLYVQSSQLLGLFAFA
jgi:hypothetical protein